ncbi:IclR family transcriptional regulator [Ferrovibrio sp.]|uniref:IclR family transcriptional regulator n=1 Tax=Ferrovibrio sp. TaxID=1917215 RepID=UPI0035B496AC
MPKRNAEKSPGPLKSAATVKSADRVLDILEAVAANAGRISFSRLMSELGIPRSSLFQLLNNLMARGYLEQDEASMRYRLGPRIAELNNQRPTPSLPSLVMPALQALSRETNETAGFYVRDGDYVTAIATCTGGQALAYTMQVGEKAPLYAVSSGKIVLGHMTDAEIKAYFARTHFQKVTPHTITTPRVLWEQIHATREEGFAYVREEFTIGIAGIATAVVVNNMLAGMVNLAVPTVRYGKHNAILFRQRLQATANRLAEIMAISA